MKVITTKEEASALNALCGLPEQAHMLLMCARTTEAGDVLDGSEDAFTELVEFIDEELSEGLAKGKAASALRALCIRIDPSCENWLGQ